MDEDLEDIQKNVSELQMWAKTWKMTFNYDKWKIMRLGKRNREKEYTMEMDLG